MEEPVAGEARRPDPLAERRCGVLLHPTSLPCGDLGDAPRFLEFLAEGRQQVWQVLPLGPTHEDRSPYQCLSSFAGEPRLLNHRLLTEWGWLPLLGAAEQALWRDGRASRVCAAHLTTLRGDEERLGRFHAFYALQAHWLEDYALFRLLRDLQGGRPWWEWPEPLRDRHPSALTEVSDRYSELLEAIAWEQFLFDVQWRTIRDHAAARGILLFGDLPIFVAHDSAEVWAGRDYFDLDPRGHPRFVAGVPPDAFSETGQRWGNPLYRWERHEADGFRWWVERIRRQLELFDLVRIDHFRGFESCWAIPADAPDARAGEWRKAPGEALFDTLHESYDPLPLVAEDLGIITPEVESLRRRYRLPGMKILQFAFDSDAANPYLPHNHEPCFVVYTGTHDNDTTLGWYRSLDEARRGRVQEYLGYPGEPMPWPMIRAALGSVARLAIVPMQDWLALDGDHRMNVPGTVEGNWRWRMEWSWLPGDLPGRMAGLARLYGR